MPARPKRPSRVPLLALAAALAWLPARAQLPTLGSGGDLSVAAERKLGMQVARELYRDPDYIEDPARPVLAVLSGNRAIATVRAARRRCVALDGRLRDLADGASPPPTAVMPLVSEGWDAITKWRGSGRPPRAARVAVARAVARAHAQGRRLRFWGTPDDERVWQMLYDDGVDLLNADDLDRLRTFLTRQR